ncbi:hypothetical protein [Neorhizobium galegae]|uniref:Uncharacterized protein n=1 Tax=Neorhizobium galegae bv. officinalis TaxID=323656 RepID=A0A0T7GFM8_NEOGA|nr:hypothetical protein [Neorhizobium galegae]CDZ45988.1 Hypothetical protein NGAL_HAMBI1189_11800 [Neorhizobium galegae bv. officinalis]
MKCLGIAVLLCFVTGYTQAADVKARPASLPENYAGPTGEELELVTGPIAARLREQYRSRLGGLFIERDQRRIVVRLTGDRPVAPETHRVRGSEFQVVFQLNAQHTVGELNWAIASSAEKIAEALPTAHARYVDERTGEIVIAVAPDPVPEEKRKALALALGVPVRIVVEDPVVPQPAMRK